MSNDFQSSSRSGNRAKRKKTNLILNGLIVLVLALIVFVAYTIFLADDDKASTKKDDPKTEEKQASNKDEAADEDKDSVNENEQPAMDDEATGNGSDEESEEAVAPEQADDSQAVVTDGDGSSNVLKTIENPSWKPVGTVQTGVHSPVYDDTSVDWQEMLTAISFATGLEQGNMAVYWLGGDKSTTNASIGTVYSNDNTQKYRVYIKWVDGEGWMPTKVEELAELEK